MDFCLDDKDWLPPLVLKTNNLKEALIKLESQLGFETYDNAASNIYAAIHAAFTTGMDAGIKKANNSMYMSVEDMFRDILRDM